MRPTAALWDYEPIPAALDAHADKATECQSRGFFEISHFVRGMDIQDLLPHATPQKVADHTRRMIDVVGNDGGFILAGSHAIQADTPVENVVAMFEAAKS